MEKIGFTELRKIAKYHVDWYNDNEIELPKMQECQHNFEIITKYLASTPYYKMLYYELKYWLCKLWGVINKLLTPTPTNNNNELPF